MSNFTVIAENLTKAFRMPTQGKSLWQSNKLCKVAVDSLSFSLKKGEKYGLIGQNGSGKTTTLKMLSTLILPDKGTASIMGYDIQTESEHVKRNIGVSVGEFTRDLYWRLSGRDNLIFFARLKDVPDSKECADILLARFGLVEVADQLVMQYSMGMKHKLSIAKAMIGNPPVLLFDEPLTGIDPVTSFEIKTMVKEKMSDKTIIWTTHNLNEIEEMCDNISIIHKGKLILGGQPSKLKMRYWDSDILGVYTSEPEAFSSLGEVQIKNNCALIRTTNISVTLKEIGLIASNGVEISEIQTLKPTLEDIFMRVIGEEKR